MKPYTHKIAYYETDRMGVTHHSNYVRIMEEARIYFLDEIGWSYAKLEEQGIISPVININCNYRKTTTFPDVINVDVWVEKISPCKLSFGYKFTVGDDTVFTATSSHCFLDASGAPMIVEKTHPALWQALKDYVKK